MKRKNLYLILISFFIFNYFTISQPVINIEKTEQKGTASINQEKIKIQAVPLPNYNIQPKYINPVFLNNKKEIFNTLQKNDVLKTMSKKTLLQNSEFSAYVLDTRDESLEYLQPTFSLSETALNALQIVPLWLENQLEYKLRLLATRSLDDDYAQLILDAPVEQKDEVAFVVAYMSFQSLTDSRFLSDKEMILRTTEMIYNVDDSLQYVDKVEYGSFETRDYYTTTKYRIFDPEQNDTIWSEIPKEIYYFYVVHPTSCFWQ